MAILDVSGYGTGISISQDVTIGTGNQNTIDIESFYI